LSANELELVGREQAHAPGYQFFIGAEYMLQTDWLFQIELEGKDEFFFSESHNSKSKSYELINVGITFLRDSWEGRVWIKNLADNNYFVRGYNFGNDPRNFYESQLWTQLGYPRNFGLSVRGRF
jgi:iron complex outermembrane receptor protein